MKNQLDVIKLVFHSSTNKILFMAKYSIEWPESQLTENNALLTGVVIRSARQFVFGVTAV